MPTFVSYLRVSTDRQGKSGLGLEAQRAAVAGYLVACPSNLIAEHIEVESGAVNSRPELAKALHLCRLTGARLLVAKLDRLSRDAHFLLGLQKADVGLTFVDLPHANTLTVGIMALMAQQERELISQRTRDALAAAKARGVRLGGYRGGPVPDAAKARAGNVAHADAFALRVAPLVHELRAEHRSLGAIAAELNRRQVRTRWGKAWQAQTVKNLLARGAKQESSVP